MSRLLLIGCGPLPHPAARSTSFAQLRAAHFRAALQADGHALTTLLLGPPGPSAPGVEARAPEDPALPALVARLAAEADAVVTAGPYLPARLAALAPTEAPLWIDLPGDPFAELDALLRRGPLPAERLAAALSAAHAPLRRADALSVISQRQRLATLGELAAIGRIGEGAPEIHAIPIAALSDWPPLRPRPIDGPLRVALSGAFNAWFDEEAAIAGLEAALAAMPELGVISTGGGVPGFFEAGAQRWVAFAARHPSRVQHHGWVDHAAIPAILAPARVGLCLDRPGLEPELGSRTRALLFAHLGLALVASPRTELVVALAADHPGAVFPVEDADPATLIAALRAAGRSTVKARLDMQRDVAARFAPLPLTAPLRAWARAPRRADIQSDPMGVLLAENARLREAIAAIEGGPTWRMLSRGHRALRSLRTLINRASSA